MTRRLLPAALLCGVIIVAFSAVVFRITRVSDAPSKREHAKAQLNGVSERPDSRGLEPGLAVPRDSATLLCDLAGAIARVKARHAVLETAIPILMELHARVFDKKTRSESILALSKLACDAGVDVTVRKLALMLLGGVPDSNVKDRIREAMALGPGEVAFYAILALSMTSFDERAPAGSHTGLVRRWLDGESVTNLPGLNLKFAEEFWEFCLAELSGDSLDPDYKSRLAAKYLRDAVQRDVPEENIYASVFSRIQDRQSLQTLSRMLVQSGDPGLRLQALELLAPHPQEIEELLPALCVIAATIGEDQNLRKAAISLLFTRGGKAFCPVLEKVVQDEMRSATPQYSVCECALSALKHLAPETLITGPEAATAASYLDRVSGTKDGPRALSNFMVFLAGSENTNGAEDLLLNYAAREDNPRIAEAAVRAMGSCPDSSLMGMKRIQTLNDLLGTRGSLVLKAALSSILSLSVSLNQRSPSTELLPLVRAAFSRIDTRLQYDPYLRLDAEFLEAYHALQDAQAKLRSSSDK